MEYLNCNLIEFSKNNDELLTCVYDGVTYESVKILQCFPMTYTNNYLSIRYEKGDETIELGIIKSIEELKESDKVLVLSDLALRYYIPEIISIKKRIVKRQYFTFVCLTNAGEKTIKIKDISYNLFITPKGELLIKDCDENYYLIKNYKESKDKNIKFIRSYL